MMNHNDRYSKSGRGNRGYRGNRNRGYSRSFAAAPVPMNSRNSQNILTNNFGINYGNSNSIVNNSTNYINVSNNDSVQRSYFYQQDDSLQNSFPLAAPLYQHQQNQQISHFQDHSDSTCSDYCRISSPFIHNSIDHLSENDLLSSKNYDASSLSKQSTSFEQKSVYFDISPSSSISIGDGPSPTQHFAHTDWFNSQHQPLPYQSPVNIELNNHPLTYLTKHVELLPEHLNHRSAVINKASELSVAFNVFSRDVADDRIGNFAQQLANRSIWDWYRIPEFAESFQVLLMVWAYFNNGRLSSKPLHQPLLTVPINENQFIYPNVKNLNEETNSFS